MVTRSSPKRRQKSLSIECFKSVRNVSEMVRNVSERVRGMSERARETLPVLPSFTTARTGTGLLCLCIFQAGLLAQIEQVEPTHR